MLRPATPSLVSSNESRKRRKPSLPRRLHSFKIHISMNPLRAKRITFPSRLSEVATRICFFFLLLFLWVFFLMQPIHLGMKKRHPFIRHPNTDSRKGGKWTKEREGHFMIEEAGIHSMSPSLFHQFSFFFSLFFFLHRLCDLGTRSNWTQIAR